MVRATDRLAPESLETYTVVRCLSCGLAYLNPRPTAETIREFYPGSYTGAGRHGLVDRLETNHRCRQQREVVEWLAARRRSRGVVLDVGCGSGDLLVALRADGWRVQGVEPAPGGAREAREQRGLDVLAGRFEDVELPPCAYDVVVFAGVLEHLHDPLAALRRAGRLLVPGGLLAVLFLPLFDSPEARFFGSRWLALDLPRHLTHFSDATFGLMASKAGLEIVGREPYSLRHNAAQLVGSVAPWLQKHRFYLAESTAGDGRSLGAQLASIGRRALFLAAVTGLRPAAHLAAVTGASPMCSYFLELRASDPDR